METPVGKPGGALFYWDFLGWTKGICFPPLGGLHGGGIGKGSFMENLENEVFEGYMKCLCGRASHYIGALWEPRGVTIVGVLREFNSVSEYLLCEESIQLLNLSEALSSLRQIHLGSFFLDPEDNRRLSMRAIWNLVKGTGLL